MGRVLVVGEALVDVVDDAAGVASEYPGGSAANVAVTVGRLGGDVTLATWIADDARGRLLGDHLAASGVTITPGSTGASLTPVATATLGVDGSATYEFDLTWELAPVDGHFDAVHVGSLGAVRDPGAAAVADLVAASRATATITFDPNIRPALADATTRSRVAALAAAADVVKASIDDLAWLHPARPPADVAAEWLAAGAAVVVVTCGAQGALAWCRAGTVQVAGSATEVVDTIGAGDAFMGALLWSLDRDQLLGATHRAHLHDLSVDVLGRHVTLASRIAATTVARRGADPPWLGDLPAGTVE